MSGFFTSCLVFLITTLFYLIVATQAQRKCSGYDEVIHDQSGKCVELGKPCGTLMAIYKSETGNGVCECDTIFGTPLVYWPQQRRCYRVYSQGPCRPGAWIVVDANTGVPTCQRNRCPYPVTPKGEYDEKTSFWFLKNGRCYETETQGFCRKNEIIRAEYVEGDPRNFGKCYYDGVASAPPPYYSVPCQPGQKWTKNRRLCKRSVRFSGRGY